MHGDIADYDTVLRFGAQCDLLTIEIEHVNAAAVAELERRGVVVRPGPAVISLVQDKLAQKEFYRRHNLPTAAFVAIERRSELQKMTDRFPVVQKLRRSGYDGRGVVVLDGPEQIDRAFDAPSVIEERVAFQKEIAVIVARAPSGKINAFPAVEMEFHPEANLVELLFAPAAIPPETEERARQLATAVAKALKIEGLLAVEMFVLPEQSLLINEIAPRPHNSGHHTIEACASSQYSEHLRAILDLPGGDLRLQKPAAMVNLLGAAGHSGAARYEGLDQVLAWPGVHVHLYGKRETRPFRKMGHVTVTAESAEQAALMARRVQKTIRVVS